MFRGEKSEEGGGEGERVKEGMGLSLELEQKSDGWGEMEKKEIGREGGEREHLLGREWQEQKMEKARGGCRTEGNGKKVVNS